MRKLASCTALALLLTVQPTRAQVIGEYEWDFEISDSACFAGINSPLGNSRLQLSYRDNEIGGVIFTFNEEIQSLPIEKVITALGVFSGSSEASSDDNPVKLGFLLVGHRGKWEEEDPISGTYLLILEPYRMVDTRMFQSDLLSIYAYGTNIGIFPLDGAEESISKLLSCDLQRTLDKFTN
ncbi:hypothetical protein [Tabrizicola sp.]|uniref:hypothetical protein n=1 Tax=Tabrizicola sp. TaxID=2005166 RepID=UPI0035ADD7CA